MQIDRRTLLACGLAAVATGPAMARSAPSSGWYDRSIIIDALGGLGDPYGPPDTSRLSARVIRELAETGVTMLRDTVMPVGNVADPWGEYQKAIESFREVVAANPDQILLVRSAADILKAKRERRFGVMVGTQDSCMVGPELDRIAQMKKDGVLSIQLTYNNANLSGDGALEPRNAGLTKLGRSTIERIEAEKVLLDLSHGGARTMAEAAGFAKRPLVISHTGARALVDHPRNTEDATIKAVADKGGVVGVYFMPFLRTGAPATNADVLDHIDHVAKVAGEDHVGIGTDNGVLPLQMDAEAKKKMDEYTAQRMKAGIASPGEGIGIYPYVEQLNRIDRYRLVASQLAKRGWSDARLEKLFGGNFLRVYREAWGG